MKNNPLERLSDRTLVLLAQKLRLEMAQREEGSRDSSNYRCDRPGSFAGDLLHPEKTDGVRGGA